MLIFFIIYSLGFVLTLFILHKFKKELGIDIYNCRPDEWCHYDEYDSNAEAFVAFSLFWPMAIIVLGGVNIARMLMKLSKFVEKKTNEPADTSRDSETTTTTIPK